MTPVSEVEIHGQRADEVVVMANGSVMMATPVLSKQWRQRVGTSPVCLRFFFQGDGALTSELYLAKLRLEEGYSGFWITTKLAGSLYSLNVHRRLKDFHNKASGTEIKHLRLPKRLHENRTEPRTTIKPPASS